MKIFASIIICTYIRANLLERLLDSAFNQTLANDFYEIIIVNDASTDHTIAVCETAKYNFSNVRYFTAKENGNLPKAANFALQYARGDVILFTDDDCILPKNWVETMVNELKTRPIIAGAIKSPTDNYLRLCHNIAEFNNFMSGGKAAYTDFIAGPNMGIKRFIIRSLQFDENNVLAPDTEFILRARSKGYRVYFEPKSIIIHAHERTTLSELFSYSKKHASATIHLRLKYESLLRTPWVLKSPFWLVIFSPVIALWVTIKTFVKNKSLFKNIYTSPLVFALKLTWCWGAAKSLAAQKT